MSRYPQTKIGKALQLFFGILAALGLLYILIDTMIQVIRHYLHI